MTKPLLPATALLICLAAFALPCFAQSTVHVNVDVYTSLGTMPEQGLGLGVAVWDDHMTDPAIPNLIKAAGFKILRYPGGSYADLYHWKTNSATKGLDANIRPQDNFENFMSLCRVSGTTPLITVNYGSNIDGTGGGDPQEAADWVKFANVTNKWQVKYWEIGNEVYGNGEYGATWEQDDHGPYPPDPKDNNKVRKGDPRLSPTAYGRNVVAFANAMKAQDPTIKIGVVLTVPGDWPDGVAPDWNSHVLTECGPYIDFVVLHKYAHGNSEAEFLANSPKELPSEAEKTRALIDKYCGANAKNVEIWITEGDGSGYDTRAAGALFAAQQFMLWMENGVANFDWWDLHNGMHTNDDGTYDDQGIFSNASSDKGLHEPAVNTPFPPYFGVQMVHYLARPGDGFVAASSDNDLVGAYAAIRKDGYLGIMLINKDPKNAATVQVSVQNAKLYGTTYRYEYLPGGKSLVTSKVKRLGQSFMVTVPPYAITDLLIPEANATQQP
jgi:hypothetical protein